LRRRCEGARRRHRLIGAMLARDKHHHTRVKGMGTQPGPLALGFHGPPVHLQSPWPCASVFCSHTDAWIHVRQNACLRFASRCGAGPLAISEISSVPAKGVGRERFISWIGSSTAEPPLISVHLGMYTRHLARYAKSVIGFDANPEECTVWSDARAQNWHRRAALRA
jgi:hypothetical protein